MADSETPGRNYEVGCGKPPKEYQFKPGQSGNPRGRPKAKKSGTMGFSELLNEPVKVTVGGVIVAPRGVDFYEWLESVTELVPVNEE